ncbi:translation factor Sua5, partial [Staphylococcus aureus]
MKYKHYSPETPISMVTNLTQPIGGLDSIAVRMPSHPIGRAILQYVNLPIAAPSAN